MGKFYVCESCNSVLELVEGKDAKPVCAGQAIKPLEVKSLEEGSEKHLPDIYVQDKVVTVQLGTVPHPMIEEHLIQWIELETDRGVYRRRLRAGDEPVVNFRLEDEKPLAVYAYCNLHGLWRAQVKG